MGILRRLKPRSLGYNQVPLGFWDVGHGTSQGGPLGKPRSVGASHSPFPCMVCLLGLTFKNISLGWELVNMKETLVELLDFH